MPARSSIILFLFILAILAAYMVSIAFTAAEPSDRWQIRSVDTMKLSRDQARTGLKDRSYEAMIEKQVREIKELGATHVAVGTPYDEEFYPYLARWVRTARKYGLNVWFRGNWSGWEGWFGYPAISRAEHIQKTEAFILKYPELFADGDIFSACPECENGGPGDPRVTKDVSGQRTFLIEEYTVMKKAFLTIDRDVRANFYSMNADVARLIHDRKTTDALDGIVVIDHYVKDPAQLSRDVREFSRTTGGKVVLGEIGAPIPDIHGSMTDEEQALWLDRALKDLSETDNLLGVNYWVHSGGTTGLYTQSGKKIAAAGVLAAYYKNTGPKTAFPTGKNSPVNGRASRYLTKIKNVIYWPIGLLVDIDEDK